MPRIPLIEDLTSGPVPAGSTILVEYDAASQWYNASLTIATRWLRDGGRVGYYVAAQPPDSVRSQLSRLGLDVEELERNGKLWIVDYYTATLGRKSKEKYATDSLKVADLSIMMSRQVMVGQPIPDRLGIFDSISCLARFNDEKAWVEYELTRSAPALRMRKTTGIAGIIRGVHSEWAYKQLEAAVDCIVDFTLQEVDKGTRNFMRIRSMRTVPFDSQWHQLKTGLNFEVTLEK